MYDLQPKEKLRYRTLKDQTWTEGSFIRQDDDGSISLWCSYTGGWRTLPAWKVQRQTTGPKGGKKWVDLEKPRWND